MGLDAAPAPSSSSELAAMATTYAASDALDAYLFECDDDALYAVSLDPLGANIPRRSCLQGWRRIAEFALGVHEPMSVAIDPETVLQGVRSVGYYIWREGRKH
jgi:hypothetical protein